MSTRSQLRFVQRVDQDDEPNDADRVAQVYRHSDGYPTSVLQDLVRLKEEDWPIATESHESAVGLESPVPPVHRVNLLGRFLRPIQTLGE